jgi:hypothetical protein
MKCFMCAWERFHDTRCPEAQPPNFKAGAYLERSRGYQAGRSGEGIGDGPNEPSYVLGYGRGVVALEEAENGFDPRGA